MSASNRDNVNAPGSTSYRGKAFATTHWHRLRSAASAGLGSSLLSMLASPPGQTIVIRPPAGPARGTIPVAPWLVVVVAAGASAIALAAWLWLYRRARNKSK